MEGPLQILPPPLPHTHLVGRGESAPYFVWEPLTRFIMVRLCQILWILCRIAKSYEAKDIMDHSAITYSHSQSSVHVCMVLADSARPRQQQECMPLVKCLERTEFWAWSFCVGGGGARRPPPPPPAPRRRLLGTILVTTNMYSANWYWLTRAGRHLIRLTTRCMNKQEISDSLPSWGSIASRIGSIPELGVNDHVQRVMHVCPYPAF